MSKNEKSGVYSARLAKLNKYTDQWVEKEEVTNYFPDNWSIHQLFHECYFAFNNKIQVSDRIYKSQSISGIIVKFVIDENGKILTFFPELNEENNDCSFKIVYN